jgi:RecA-family ATPase
MKSASDIITLDEIRGGREAPEKPIPELPIISADTLADKEVPPRSWLVPDMIPDRTVTMVSGDGAVGKSLLMLQLAVAVAIGGREWIGTLPEQGPVLFISAEDDLDEMHRRLHAIASAERVDLTDLYTLHLMPLAGQDAVMAVPEGKAAVITPTNVWRGLVDRVGQIKPKLVIFDTLADVFAGNENARTDARQFIGILRGLAIEHNLAVVVIAHPSLSGLASGSGTSGSTAWNNSVRSRLYFETISADDESEADADLRVLRVKKTNYGPPGLAIHLRWADGRFVLDKPASGLDKLAADAKADRAFLDLLQQITSEGRNVSPNPSATFAPSVFAAHPKSPGVKKTAFEAAMNRLLSAGLIRVEAFGPPSRMRSRLALAEAGDDS